MRADNDARSRATAMHIRLATHGGPQLVPHLSRANGGNVLRRCHMRPKACIGNQVSELDKVGMIRIPGDRIVDQHPRGNVQGTRPIETPSRQAPARTPDKPPDLVILTLIMDHHDRGARRRAGSLKPLQERRPGQLEALTIRQVVLPLVDDDGERLDLHVLQYAKVRSVDDVACSGS